mgnify:CR=1 FL=1
MVRELMHDPIFLAKKSVPATAEDLPVARDLLETLHRESDSEGYGADLLRQSLSVFRTCVEGMPVEEKRAAVRTVVRKVVWDGVNAHVVLFGADEDAIEFPDMDDRLDHSDDEGGEEEPLEAFADVDYGDFEEENSGLGKNEPVGGSKSPWGEDSK